MRAYRFRVVDVVAFGHSSDGGYFAVSAFGRVLQEGTLNLPKDAPLPGAENLGPMPHTFVGNEAFPPKLVHFFYSIIYHYVV